MVFTILRTMEELNLLNKLEKKKEVGKGFTSKIAKHRYIQLTKRMNKNEKRKRAKSILSTTDSLGSS